MSEQPKVQPQISDDWITLEEKAKDLPPNYVGFFDVKAMRIDIEKRGWIDSDAKWDQEMPPMPRSVLDQRMSSGPSARRNKLILERVGDGFVANLTEVSGPSPWSTRPIPIADRDDALPWMKVVKFIYD